jgi:hypothetical protein
MEAAKQLNYAPKPPAARRRWRIIYATLFIIALIVGAILCGPDVWDETRLLVIEHECLNYSLPPNHVVFEIGSGKLIHAEVPPPQAKLFELSSPLYATIFIHRMQLPNGHPYFVNFFAGSLANWNSQSTPHITELCSERWNIGTRFTLAAGCDYPSFQPITDDHHWKFFAGQPDPNNPSHFTFDYELDDTRHTCDAWLGNDDKLLISQRP